MFFPKRATANTTQFMDPDAGYCGVFHTSINPLGDPETAELVEQWYRALRKQYVG